jgi:DNA-binding NarL/FixJ family response regulator
VSLKALIVDDEAPARDELRYLLDAHPEVEVVGEAASAREALVLAGSVRYDVVF